MEPCTKSTKTPLMFNEVNMLLPRKADGYLMGLLLSRSDTPYNLRVFLRQGDICWCERTVTDGPVSRHEQVLS